MQFPLILTIPFINLPEYKKTDLHNAQIDNIINVHYLTFYA